MTIAFPSQSSPLHDLCVSWLVDIAAIPNELPEGRQLVYRHGPDVFLLCRGRDIPGLVYEGVVDLGLTGYDVVAEWASKNSADALASYWVGECRLSHVVLAGTNTGAEVLRIYAEYPGLATRWRQANKRFRDSQMIPTSGSTEGIVSVDANSLGVFLTTTGRTLRENGLEVIETLLTTDLCLVRRQGIGMSVGGFLVENLEMAEMPSYVKPPTG